MRVVPLASSSKANAYLIEHAGCVVLLDCGLSCRELACRLKSLRVEDTDFGGFSCDQIQAVLLTHSHGDHTKGLEVFLHRYDVPVYANLMTAEKVIEEFHLPPDSFVCFENGQTFQIGPFAVQAFSIPHDTSDPVGYLIKTGAGADESSTYFHGTDIGTPLDSIGIKLREADIATLESNHDPVLLRQSGRAPNLIQRIAGPRGHLSNDQACELVRRFASPKLRKLMLAHLSRDCNAPHIAEREMRATLKAMGREDIELTILDP